MYKVRVRVIGGSSYRDYTVLTIPTPSVPRIVMTTRKSLEAIMSLYVVFQNLHKWNKIFHVPPWSSVLLDPRFASRAHFPNFFPNQFCEICEIFRRWKMTKF